MDLNDIKSHIIISNSPQNTLENLIKIINTNNYRIFDKDEFLVEDAHELISHAYIASENIKYLIIKTTSCNTISQNALLKLLEEPPANIVILFIVPNKSIFLPTIRSRLPIKIEKTPKEEIEIDFDFDSLSIKSIFEFFKKNKHMEKKEAKVFLEKAFEYYKKLPFSKEQKLASELEEFDRSFRLIELNSPAKNIISTILLLLLEKKSAL